MACSFLRSTIRSSALRNWMMMTCRNYGTWEPDYLDDKPEVAEYDTINIRIRGYDFPVVESYSKFVHNMVDRLGIQSSSYPVPPRSNRINVFKTWSTTVVNNYDLNMYERVVQIQYLPSTLAPIMLDALHQNIPAGITLSAGEPDAAEEEFRYVPDVMLMDLQSQVKDIQQAKEDRKKK